MRTAYGFTVSSALAPGRFPRGGPKRHARRVHPRHHALYHEKPGDAMHAGAPHTERPYPERLKTTPRIGLNACVLAPIGLQRKKSRDSRIDATSVDARHSDRSKGPAPGKISPDRREPLDVPDRAGYYHSVVIACTFANEKGRGNRIDCHGHDH